MAETAWILASPRNALPAAASCISFMKAPCKTDSTVALRADREVERGGRRVATSGVGIGWRSREIGKWAIGT